MRLIDADAYAADLWKLRENYQMLDDTHTADKIMHGIFRAEQALKEQPTVAAPCWHRVEEPPKWVSVFDDLPRHNAVVVVSDGKRSWDVGQYHLLFKADDRTIWWWKKHTTRKVLWWMYKEDAIPEPPKEDA